MGKVRTTQQMRAKTNTARTRPSAPKPNAIPKPVNKMNTGAGLSGKIGGTGLDEYNLDLMKLE